MSSWKNSDSAANAPLWAAAAVNKEPTPTNRINLFDNSTKDYWKDSLPAGGDRQADVAIGVFGVSADEAQVDKHTHTGWVQRKVFYGGRAGRVQEEVLVAMNTMNSDAEDTVYKDTVITFTVQPVNKTVTAGALVANMFSVTAKSTPTKSMQYQWQQSTNGGTTYTNISGAAWTGYTTNTLGITAGHTATGDTGMLLRCVVTASGTGASATSTAGTLTVTA
jgi:hypothetical protein